jgi:hypothetical protein
MDNIIEENIINKILNITDNLCGGHLGEAHKKRINIRTKDFLLTDNNFYILNNNLKKELYNLYYIGSYFFDDIDNAVKRSKVKITNSYDINGWFIIFYTDRFNYHKFRSIKVDKTYFKPYESQLIKILNKLNLVLEEHTLERI